MPEVKATIKPAIPRSLPCLLNEDVSDSQTPRHINGKVKKKHKYSNQNRSGRNSNAPLLPRTGSVLQNRHLIIYRYNPPA